MQTINIQVAWAKLDALLTSNTCLIDSGHIVPAQEILPILKEAKEEFAAELSSFIGEVEKAVTKTEVKTSEKGGSLDDERSDGDGSDETGDGEE